MSNRCGEVMTNSYTCKSMGMWKTSVVLLLLAIHLSSSGIRAHLQCMAAELGSRHTLECDAQTANISKENLLWAVKTNQETEPRIVATCDEHHCAVTDSHLYSASLNVEPSGVSSFLTLKRVSTKMALTFECWYWDSITEKILYKSCYLNVYANPTSSFCRDPEISKDGLKMRVTCVTRKVFPKTDCTFVRQRVNDGKNQEITLFDASPGENGIIDYELTETPENDLLLYTSECSLTTPLPKAGIYTFTVRVKIASDYYSELVSTITAGPITVSTRPGNAISWDKGGLAIGVSLSLMLSFGIALTVTICVKRRARLKALKRAQVAREMTNGDEPHEEIQLVDIPQIDEETPNSSNIYDSIKSHDLSDSKVEDTLVYRVEVHGQQHESPPLPSVQVHYINESSLHHEQHDLRHSDFHLDDHPPEPPLSPPPQRYANMKPQESRTLQSNSHPHLSPRQSQLYSQHHRATTSDIEELGEEENNERNESPFYFEIPDEELCMGCCSPPKKTKHLKEIKVQEQRDHQRQSVQDQTSAKQGLQMNETNFCNGENHQDDDIPCYLELLPDSDNCNSDNEQSRESNTGTGICYESHNMESMGTREHHHYDAIDN